MFRIEAQMWGKPDVAGREGTKLKTKGTREAESRMATLRVSSASLQGVSNQYNTSREYVKRIIFWRNQVDTNKNLYKICHQGALQQKDKKASSLIAHDGGPDGIR